MFYASLVGGTQTTAGGPEDETMARVTVCGRSAQEVKVSSHNLASVGNSGIGDLLSPTFGGLGDKVVKTIKDVSLASPLVNDITCSDVIQLKYSQFVQ